MDSVEKTIRCGLSLGMKKRFSFQNSADRFATHARMVEIMYDDVNNYEEKIRKAHPEHMENIYRIEQALAGARANLLDMRDIVNACERSDDA